MKLENKMILQVIGGILNILWYGIADILKGHFLIALVKGIIHYFITTFLGILLSVLGLVTSETLWLLCLWIYIIFVFIDGYKTFRKDENEIPVR